jgi:hypothetical protein
MNFTDDQIRIEPGHQARTWSSCSYYVGDTYLFHERDYYRLPPIRDTRRNIPGVLAWMLQGDAPGENNHQWFDYHDCKRNVEAVAKKHGGEALEDFYPEDPQRPGYFLAFSSTEKALAFCRSEDFDKLCLTHAKL